MSYTKSNQQYPVFLSLDQLQILLIGAGNVGQEKLQQLLSNAPDARVIIVAESVKEEVRQLLQSYPLCSLQQRPFEESDLDNKDLVLLATDNEEIHQRVRAITGRKGRLIDVNDTPGLNIFYVDTTAHNGNSKNGFAGNGIHIDKTDKIKAVLNTGLTDGGESDNRWRKVAMYSLLAFTFMLIGHFIFSYFPLHQIADGTYAWYKTSGKEFGIILLAGFLAQIVDGALGMGYGVTSATILLSAGVSPAAMSGSIHTAEMFASGASGYSHYKFGNVNKKLFKALVIPGVLGAITGAVLLVLAGEKYGNYIKPLIAMYTMFLGIKFIITAFREKKKQKKFRRYRLLAAIGGFFDSFAGGGWGPIVTTTLINNGRSHKYVIGSVSLTEFFVTLGSAFTFFTMIGVSHWQTILALIIGGFLAAPLAAKLAGRLPRKLSFILLGALVIFWSSRILIKLL
jgi:uncharacterized membrane protein YfcA